VLAPTFARVAVTPEQIARFQLPEAPAKQTDKRGDWQGGTVQAEALPPDALAAELRAALHHWTDSEARARALALEEEERAELLALVEGGRVYLDELDMEG